MEREPLVFIISHPLLLLQFCTDIIIFLLLSLLVIGIQQRIVEFLPSPGLIQLDTCSSQHTLTQLIKLVILSPCRHKILVRVYLKGLGILISIIFQVALFIKLIAHAEFLELAVSIQTTRIKFFFELVLQLLNSCTFGNMLDYLLCSALLFWG